jgi:hypothetical protein
MELAQETDKLKRRVAELESWEAEKQRYELTELAPERVCYTVKEALREGEPIHRLCANCFGAGKKNFLQLQYSDDFCNGYQCHSCGQKLSIDKHRGPKILKQQRSDGRVY